VRSLVKKHWNAAAHHAQAAAYPMKTYA